MVKVESHIEVEQAPNAFYWLCNGIADKLATRAIDHFSLDELKNKSTPSLRGTRAICVIDGCQVNSDLQNVLQEKMMGVALKNFLMEKYGWNNSIFQTVFWEAHQAELNKTPIIQRPTLIKYMHGWLATKRRRCREGAFNSLCDKTWIREMIHMIYRDLRSVVQYKRQEIFQLTEREMMDQPLQSQIAWLAKLSFLFPEHYHELELATVGKVQADMDLELQCKRIMGHQCWE